jgi:hypothetical protein
MMNRLEILLDRGQKTKACSKESTADDQCSAALTRAKKLVVVVGPERAIHTAVTEVDGDKRLSTLQPRIQVRPSKLHLRRLDRDAWIWGRFERLSKEIPVSKPATNAAVQLIMSE